MNSRRLMYLNSIGLNHDPFRNPVSEYDLSDQTRREEHAASARQQLNYFVSPLERKGDLRKWLRAYESQAVYAEPGMGKSMSRLVLNASCRYVPDGTLITTYLLGGDMGARPAAATHHYKIVRQLALDLLVQIIEQFTARQRYITVENVHALARLIRFSGPQVQRLIRRIASNLARPTSKQKPTESYWLAIGRMPIRHIPHTQELQRFLQQLRHFDEVLPLLPDQMLLPNAISIVKAWGFERVFLLIDGVDSRRRDADEMFQLIEGLVESDEQFAELGILPKYFLADELRELIESATPTIAGISLTHWNREKLRELLSARFRAAGSRRMGFNDLTESNWPLSFSLDELLLKESVERPRKLISLIDVLIDIHTAKQDMSRAISFVEWNQVQTEIMKPDNTKTELPHAVRQFDHG